MGFKSNFNQGDFDRDSNRQKEELYARVLNAFIRAGENFLTQAREQVQDHNLGTYMDQTTNLRNSIQYIVIRDGEVVKAGESQNSEENMGLIQGMIKPTGFQLIAIAGMNYASYVESKGYNVISIQGEQMIVNLEGYLKAIGIEGGISSPGMPDDYEPGL
jgi:hypothetical protein